MDIINLTSKNKQLYDRLSAFVKEATAGRDETHGLNHAERVVLNSLKILYEECKGVVKDNTAVAIIISAAWLHDVADHKYDHDGTLKQKVHKFIYEQIFPKSPEWAHMIETIIDNVSFSKEAKCIKEDTYLEWEKNLGDAMYFRNMVSDGDKLEAIGPDGLIRCILYGREIHPNAPDEEIVLHVKRHAGEKLLLLKDLFIRTEAGKRMAEPLHLEMMKQMLHIDFLVQIHK